MSNIYSAPAADLVEVQADGDYGSLERGTSGNYRFSIGETLSEAWERTRGAKLPLLLSILLYLVIYLVVATVAGFIFGPGPTTEPGIGLVFGTMLQQIVIVAITTPLAAGLMLQGLRRAVDAPVSPTAILGYYGRTLPLFLTYLIMSVLIFIGTLLLVIPGIYLSVCFMLALPLVAEKGLGPWEALMASRKAVHKRWFAIAGFGIVIFLINAVAMIPLGIGLIWTAPMSLIAFGVLYRNVFGCEAETRAA